MIKLKTTFIFLSLSLLFTSYAHGTPSFKKVTIVVLENTNYANAISQPFMASLIKQGALLNNFMGVIHPSQGNYIAMTAGDSMGIKSDKDITLNVSHIGDLLEARGLSWKLYAEGFPGNCFLGNQGSYVRKHNPFISYNNIATNVKRCNDHLQNAKAFDVDLAASNIPNYSFYVPDLKNDGHDTGVKYADNWLAQKFGPLLKNRTFMKDMLVVITFDESGASPVNHIGTILLGDSVNAGTQSSALYDHYSVLKTIESAWNLGNLGKKDTTAAEIVDVFN
jgi:acid phosphatase